MTIGTNKFQSIASLHGEQALEALRHAHVMIVGIGGVGSWAAEIAARSGIGRLTLVDPDEICISNTNRQIHTTNSNIGKSKAVEMQQRITSFHPECEIRTIETFYSKDTHSQIFDANVDFVIDAIDDAKAKATLIHHCKETNLPAVVVGSAGGVEDPAKIKISDLNRAYNDPLLARVRKILRREHTFPGPNIDYGMTCVFSFEKGRIDTSCQTQSDPLFGNSKLNCNSGYGSAGYITGSMGFYAAGIAINHLVKPKKK